MEQELCSQVRRRRDGGLCICSEIKPSRMSHRLILQTANRGRREITLGSFEIFKVLPLACSLVFAPKHVLVDDQIDTKQKVKKHRRQQGHVSALGGHHSNYPGSGSSIAPSPMSIYELGEHAFVPVTRLAGYVVYDSNVQCDACYLSRRVVEMKRRQPMHHVSLHSATQPGPDFRLCVVASLLTQLFATKTISWSTVHETLHDHSRTRERAESAFMFLELKMFLLLGFTRNSKSEKPLIPRMRRFTLLQLGRKLSPARG